MKMRFALAASLLALATPVVAQQMGVVTYATPGWPSGATSVTINYNTETIVWHYPNGFDFTDAIQSEADFDNKAALIVHQYGQNMIGSAPQ